MAVREVQSGELLTASLWNDMVRLVNSKSDKDAMSKHLETVAGNSETELNEILQLLLKSSEQINNLLAKNQHLKAELLLLEAKLGRKVIPPNFVVPEMVLIKGDTFKMSNPSNPDAKAERDVTLNDFWIGKYHVTQEQWVALMGKNPSNFVGRNLPVENVSWHDANAYIFELNKVTGKKYRLPTEAEWEYAARGNELYLYPGNSDVDAVAWHTGNSGNKTQPVGLKQPNAFGLYDIAGNVWHWCYDRHGNYTNTAVSNPKGESQGANRVLRGGAWSNRATNSRTSFRHCTNVTTKTNDIGFRLALDK